MNRLFLPLILVGMLFAPLYTQTTKDAVSNEEMRSSTSAFDILRPTVDCPRNQEFSVSGECEPKQGMRGLALAGGVGAAGGAIVLALLGFVSIIRRSSAFLTLLAGLAIVGVVGSIGYGVYQAGADAAAQLGWGGYGAGAAGLIAALAGMLGMRSDE